MTTITELAKLVEEEGPRPEPSTLPAPFAKEDNLAKIGAKESALRAAREEDLSIPAALDRTKGMTPEDFTKLRDKLAKQNVKGKVTKLKPQPPVKPSTLTKTDKKNIAAIKKEQAAAEKAKKAEGLAKLKAMNAEKKAVRDAAKATKAPQKAAGAPKPSKAPKAAKTAKPASEARKGTKAALIGDLLKRKEGCTTADILKACNWPAVSVPQQAQMLGVGLRKEKQGKVTRYWAI